MSRVANILLVEDDTLDIIHVERTLKKLDLVHKLHVAKNGEEALNMLKGKNQKAIPYPDIVMLDINMPKMNGLEFLHSVREDEALKNLKIFMLTTSNDEGDKYLSSRYGISGYIIKPLGNSSAGSMDNFNLFIDLMNLKK